MEKSKKVVKVNFYFKLYTLQMHQFNKKKTFQKQQVQNIYIFANF